MNQYRENSYIRIYVEGYDEFTGRRLIFQSPDYTIDDIVPGKYQSLSFERNYKKGFEKQAFSIVDNK